MKRFLFIVIASVAYLLFSSRSCGPEQKDESALHEAELIQERKDIRNEFESDDLSQKSLRAFEVKAIQKLVDFSDYLRIYSNKQMAESFKDQSRLMIGDIFISDSIQISHFMFLEPGKKNLTLSAFLDNVAMGNFCETKFDSIHVSEPFRQVGEFKYEGKLSFSARLKGCTSKDTILIKKSKFEADIFALKVNKSFGNDTLRIWSVFLGNIR